MILIKRAILCFIALMSVTTAMANDAVYFTSGSMLIPMKETNVSVDKEILSITIGKDRYAFVDVYYEFVNNESAKTVLMGFESEPQDKDDFASGGHPYIKDFTVTMNDKPLKYTNSTVTHKSVSEDGQEYSHNAYVYSFNATFQPGRNIVHHTYRFLMSENSMSPYQVPYWLTPATRWANHKIDDFTLRIKNERNDAFYMCDSLFMSAPFKVTGGQGRFYQFEENFGVHLILCQLVGDAALEWHAKDFCPKSDMEIASAERSVGGTALEDCLADVVVDNEGKPVARCIGQTPTQYLVFGQDYGWVDKAGHSVRQFKADEGQGYVYPSEGAGKQINVRQKPTVKSPVITKMNNDSDNQDCYECLGVVDGGNTDDGFTWYKVKVNDKVGYVRFDLIKWTPIAF